MTFISLLHFGHIRGSGTSRLLCGCGIVPALGKAPVFGGLTLRSAGIKPVVPDEMFMLWGDMLGKFCNKISRFQELYIFSQVVIVLCVV